jgi:hypothetical protein
MVVAASCLLNLIIFLESDLFWPSFIVLVCRSGRYGKVTRSDGDRFRYGRENQSSLCYLR